MLNAVVLGISLHSKDHTPLLLLYPLETKKIISLHIDPMEAFTISKALHGFGKEKTLDNQKKYEDNLTTASKESLTREERILYHPMVHDLFIDSLSLLGSNITSVFLLKHPEDLYTAEVVINGIHGSFSQICRPADAITLALRARSSLYIDEAFISHAEDLSEVMDSLPEHIQILAKAGIQGLLNHAPKYSENIDRNTSNVEDSTVINHSNFDTTSSLHKRKISNASLDLKGADKKGVNGFDSPSKESDHWKILLSSLTPETKKRM